MNPDFTRLMQEATRLTRAGDLQAATAAIQSAWAHNSGAHASPPSDSTAPPFDDDVIDVEARVVPNSPAACASGHASAFTSWRLNPSAAASPNARGTPQRHADASGDDTAPPKAHSHNAPHAQASRRADSAHASTASHAAGDFISGRYTGARGQHDYKLYIPPQAAQSERPLPLIVMLHGCTQNPDDFARGTAMNDAAREQGCYVLYPAQSQQANPQRCWNWFKHNHQRRDRGEPALLAGMTRAILAQHRIDPDRVYVAGLSAGGAMAAILGQAYPDLYAAVGVHSGLAAGAATDLPSALAAMKGQGARTCGPASHIPTIVFHGDADATVHPTNGTQIIAASAGADARATEDIVHAPGTRRTIRNTYRQPDGRVVAEHWRIQGSPHAWSGGRPEGSYTDSQGPNATAEMLRFFAAHTRRASNA